MKSFIKVAFAVALLSLSACNKNQDTDAQAAQDAEAQEEVIEATPLEEAEEAVEEEAENMTEDAPVQLDEALFQKKEWPINNFNGEPLKVQDKASIAFHDDGRISGNSGCNNYMGAYRVDEPGTLSIELGGMTMMACGEDAMAVEKQMSELLPQIVAYEIDEESGALTLRTAEGDELTE